MNEKDKVVCNSAFFFIGFSAAGKTTLAKLYKNYLDKKGYKTFLLDGNEMSDFKILNKYDGFDINSRLKRALDLTHLVNWIKSQGIIPIVAVIGQPLDARNDWRKNIDGYKQIFLKCSLNICKQRDNKNIYINKNGSNKSIIGQDIKFDEPENSDLVLDSSLNEPNQLLDILINHRFIA